MRRFFTTTLGQILAIIVTSSALTFVLFLAFLYYPGWPRSPPWPWDAAFRIKTLVELLDNVSENERAPILAAAQTPDFSIRLTEAPSVCPALSSDARDLEAMLQAQLPEGLNIIVRGCDTGDALESIQALVPLDNRMLDIRTHKIGHSPPKITFPFISALLFTTIGVAAMSAWAVWRVVRPLRRLSEKVDAFGRSISISPIEEEGPLEIRRAAQVFNLMQERIALSIADRTRMLAAISHDLRTPLTRMRLQLDTNSGNIARDKLLRDVDLMRSMVTSALAFLSGSFDQEDKEWLDLGALLSTLCDEFGEGSVAVSYEGPEQIRFFCRPNAITRAMTNLVENGTHFGTSVLITASVEGEAITIDVVDDGPGIPKDRLQDVLEPFVRLDPSRSNRPGSVGLGLSIVKEIVEGHGGVLELIDRQPTGLIARITLPKMAEAKTSL